MLVWILLPAYNEEASLPKLLPKIKETFESKKQSYRIVVVEDGATDNTSKLLKEYKKEYPLEIVGHWINRGLGETEDAGRRRQRAGPVDRQERPQLRQVQRPIGIPVAHRGHIIRDRPAGPW